MRQLFPLAALFASVACTQALDVSPATPSEATRPKLQGRRALALEAPTGSSRIDDRLRELQAMVTRQPDKLDAWVLLGRTWVQKARQAADAGYYANAEAAADAALDLRPEYPLALGLKALVLMNDHRFTDARDQALRVLAKDGDDLMALGNLADAEIELGHFEAAADATQRMVDLKPNLPSYARAAYLRFLQGDHLAAKRSYRLAMDAGQNTQDSEPLAWVTSEAARLFWLEGDLDGAEAGFDRALKATPDYPAALVGKARIELARGHASEASALARRAYEISALAETAWLWGDAAKAAGDEKTSAEAYAKLIRRGEHGEGRVLAAFLATENREIDKALLFANRELESRGEIYTHDAKAWALYRAGRMPEALASISYARRLGTLDPLLLFHEGAIRVATGDKKRGFELIERALKLNPHFQPHGAEEARVLLAERS